MRAGNRFSRNHTRLDPDAHPEFWAWSWADMAEHDVPAMVEHVAAATGQAKMVYLGYSQVGPPVQGRPLRGAPMRAARSSARRGACASPPRARRGAQGSMIGLAALASQPAVAARVSLALLLAPVAFTAHMASLPFLVTSRLGLDRAMLAAGVREWGALTPARAARAQRVCTSAPRVCAAYLAAVAGAGPAGNLEASTLATMMAHFPVGTSVLNMAHWSQARAAAGGRARFACVCCRPLRSGRRAADARAHPPPWRPGAARRASAAAVRAGCFATTTARAARAAARATRARTAAPRRRRTTWGRSPRRSPCSRVRGGGGGGVRARGARCSRPRTRARQAASS